MRVWLDENKASAPHTIVISAELLVCAALVGGILTWRHGGDDFISFALAVMDPVFAALLLVLAQFAMPSLIGVQPGFPKNLTVPIVYIALLSLVAYLGSGGAAGVQAIHEHTRYDFIWRDLKVLAILFGVQVAVLTVVLIGAIRETPKVS